MRKCSQICFVTGPPQCGKTTFLQNVIVFTKTRNFNLGGFIALGLWQNNQRSGFILEELETGLRAPLSGRSPHSGEMGGYVFYPQGFTAGLKTLTPRALGNKNLIMVDEVGWLEIRGDGWASALPYLVELAAKQIWVVRDAMLNEVCHTWNFTPGLIINVTASDAKIKMENWLTKMR